MFGSVRFGRRKLTVISLVCFAVLLAVCVLTLRVSPPDTVSIGGGAYPLSVGGREDIESFIGRCGYVPDSLVSETEVTVPEEWNRVYTDYAELQRAQGLSLERYRGRSAAQYVYSLKDSESFAAVLVSDGRIIAAHTCTMIYGDGIGPLITEQIR